MDKRVEEARQAIADGILKRIEAEPLAWSKGWYTAAEPPRNASTGKRYRGWNFVGLLLEGEEKGYRDPRWLTFNQARDLGAHVKSGEHGTRIFHYHEHDFATGKPFDPKTLGGMSADERADYMSENVKRGISTATVFNGEQVAGLEPWPRKEMGADEAARQNALVERVIAASEAEILYGRVSGLPGGAYYMPSRDAIHLPEIRDFKSMQDYYVTALHEMSHSTGHASRLNRPMVGWEQDEKEYAREELRAEFASLFLQAELGIRLDGAHYDNHAAYVQAYAGLLRDDKNELFGAIADAQRIADYAGQHYAAAIAGAETENTEGKERESAAAAPIETRRPAVFAVPGPTVDNHPILKTYRAAKEQQPDAVVFYRVGDFYETLFDDAKTVSKELDLILTGRDFGLAERAPMTGVPYHAVDGYIGKLVEKGYKIAFAESAGQEMHLRPVIRPQGEIPRQEQIALTEIAAERGEAEREHKKENISAKSETTPEKAEILQRALEQRQWTVESLAYQDGNDKKLTIIKADGLDAYAIFESETAYAIGDELRYNGKDLEKLNAEYVADTWKRAYGRFDSLKDGRESPEDSFKPGYIRSLRYALLQAETAAKTIQTIERMRAENNPERYGEAILVLEGTLSNVEARFHADAQDFAGAIRALSPYDSDGDLTAEQAVGRFMSDPAEFAKACENLIQHATGEKKVSAATEKSESMSDDYAAEEKDNAAIVRVADKYREKGEGQAASGQSQNENTAAQRAFLPLKEIYAADEAYGAVCLYNGNNRIYLSKGDVILVEEKGYTGAYAYAVSETAAGSSAGLKAITGDKKDTAGNLLDAVRGGGQYFLHEYQEKERKVVGAIYYPETNVNPPEMVAYDDADRLEETFNSDEEAGFFQHFKIDAADVAVYEKLVGDLVEGSVAAGKAFELTEKDRRQIQDDAFQKYIIEKNTKTKEAAQPAAQAAPAAAAQKPAAPRPMTDYRKRNLARLADIERNTPDEMKALPNWCVYKQVWDGEKKKRVKRILKPYDAPYGEQLAKCNNPSTWRTFDVALKFARENGYEGLSFAVDDNRGFTFIDLDKVADEKGGRSLLAQKALSLLQGTYAEKSMSGTGLHFVVKGDLLEGGRFLNRKKTPEGGFPEAEIEAYSERHFLSMTGAVAGGAAKVSEPSQEAKAFLQGKLGERQIFKNSDAGPRRNFTPTAQEVIESLRRSKKSGVFSMLYDRGDTSAYGNDHSHADHALLNMLAFFSDCDKGVMDSIFRSSALYRPDRGEKYLQRSIDDAVNTLCKRPDHLTGGSVRGKAAGRAR
jgi:antirestriction protein ArdC